MGYIAKPPLGTPLNRSHPLAQKMAGCILLYPGAYFDSVNPGIQGTGVNVASREGCPSFNGSSSYITFGDVDQYDQFLDDWSWVARYKIFSLPGNDGTICGKALLGALDGRYYFAIVDNVFYAGYENKFGSSATSDVSISSYSTKYPLNNWHMAASAALRGSYHYHYHNGVYVGAASAVPDRLISNNIVCHFGIGAYQNTAGTAFTQFWLDGIVDFVYLYRKALTASEIQSLYIDPYQMFRPSMPYWFWSSLGGVTYTLDCSAGAVTIAGGSAGVFLDRLLTGSAGQIALAGGNAGLLKDSLLTGDAGAATVAGGQAQVLKDSLLNGSAGQVTITGGQAQALKDSLLTGSAGAATIAGGSGDLLKDSLLTGSAGTVTVAGGNAAILRAFVLAALAGAVTVEGGSAGLLKDSILTGSAGAVTVAGGDAEITLIIGGATYTLNCLSGEVTAAGGQAQLLKDSILAGTGAAVSLAGLTADLLLTRSLTGNAGAVEITGNDATLIYHRLLAGSAARVTLAGGQAVLIYSLEAFVPAVSRTIIMATESRVVVIPLESRSIEVED